VLDERIAHNSFRFSSYATGALAVCLRQWIRAPLPLDLKSITDAVKLLHLAIPALSYEATNKSLAYLCLTAPVFVVQGNKCIHRHSFDAGVSSRDSKAGTDQSSKRALMGLEISQHYK
jgi:hypothetical protein